MLDPQDDGRCITPDPQDDKSFHFAQFFLLSFVTLREGQDPPLRGNVWGVREAAPYEKSPAGFGWAF